MGYAFQRPGLAIQWSYNWTVGHLARRSKALREYAERLEKDGSKAGKLEGVYWNTKSDHDSISQQIELLSQQRMIVAYGRAACQMDASRNELQLLELSIDAYQRSSVVNLCRRLADAYEGIANLLETEGDMRFKPAFPLLVGAVERAMPIQQRAAIS